MALAVLVLMGQEGCITEEIYNKEISKGTEQKPMEKPFKGDYIREDLFRGRLEMSGDPILNTERDITLTVKPIVDSPNTTIKILLPFEVEFVKGAKKEWHVALKRGEKRQFTTRVKIVDIGEWRIEAYVEGIFPVGKESRSYSLIGISGVKTGKIKFPK